MLLNLLLLLLLLHTKGDILKNEGKTQLDTIEKLKIVDGKDSSFKYDNSRIKEILDQNNFPQEYNFLEELNIEPKIKTQTECDSSWSFASTTALSYRFLKNGKNIDLSPYEPFSSLNKKCGEEHSAIGSQFYLIKNGTITEKCNPTITENCFERHYAKNAYTIEPIYDEEHYYDYIKIIMDQLINNGPVVSSILFYEDLKSGGFCNKDVYFYDGESDLIGRQDVVIVGYGLSNNKYYWLIQNSLGSNWCEDGLAKIEFGKVGIETVSFSEPYIKGEYNETKDISVNLNNIIDKCFIIFKTNSANEEIKNNFEIILKNQKNEDRIFYYCGVVPLINEDSNICLNDLNDDISEGIYEIYNISSLGKENEFTINNNINFYLNKDHFRTILNLENRNLYVSERGSKILIESYNCEECLFRNKIYPNLVASTAFENCKQINFNNLERNYKYYLVSCTINENELRYFDYSYNNGNNAFMAYDRLCGLKTKIDATIYKLDKTKYPLLRIKDFKLSDEDFFDKESLFTLIADVEGSISGFTSNDNQFNIFIDIYNNSVKSYELNCNPKDIQIKINYTINCHFNQKINKIEYNKVMLYTYYYQLDSQPYEVIIPKNFYAIKNNQTDEDDPKPFRPSSSSSGSKWWIYVIVAVVVIIAIVVIALSCK